MSKEKSLKFQDWSEYGYTESDWKALTKVQRYAIRYPERIKASRQKYAAANKSYMSDRQRKYQLRDKYGITEEQYNEMFLLQNGCCAICGSDGLTGKWKRLCVDHCHHTGSVRELLCNECNRGMGLLKDNADLLRKAAGYLDKHKINYSTRA